MNTLVKRFWAKVRISGKDDCWQWLASKNSKGYGKIGSGGKTGRTLKAHRVAYELSIGEIPAGKHVLHTCDNPSCCNPNHLFLGDQAINMRDCADKGRNRNGETRGEDHSTAKLTEVQVLAIRIDNRFLKDIAFDYGVAMTTISAIKNRRTWSHV